MRRSRLIAVLMAIAMMVTLFASCGSSVKKDADAGSSAPDWTAYDKLIKDIYADTDLVDREAKMHQAEDMLMETGAVIPIYYYNDLYLEKPNFSGDYSTLFGTKYFMYAKKDGKATDVMRINLASEPDHLDPALNSSVDGAALASNSFVGLYTSNANDEIVPALADGMPTVSEDGTQYTINLKKYLKWSDGSPLTANDFVYAWKRAADPNTAADYGYLFDVFAKDDNDVIKVQANGYDQIQFTLNAPCPYMMNLLAFPVYMPVPQKAIEAASDWETNPGAWTSEAGFISNGAYTLKEWKHNESMVYVKNPYFYDAANVSVDELHFMLSADDTAILAAYKAGNLDYADTVPNGEIPTLKSWPDFHVIDNLGTYYVGFNVKSKMFDGKTADEANKMRRALALLINRQYIIDTIGQTQQEAATSFIPTGMSDSHGGKFKENDDAYTYPDQASRGYYSVDVNVDKAVELLKEAGFKFDDNNMLSSETPIHINYLTNEGTGHEGVAQCLQQDFAKIGITMDISVEDWQTFLNDRKSGNFDVAREGWLADYDDPINMLEMFTSDSGNNDCQLGK
ncbi:MAG: peptide ABC transporter substrate-binding protein [Clostridia bacterium]|nr:peptide ABC transporter substrate-binding protein [Clostridia bacterium]